MSEAASQIGGRIFRAKQSGQSRGRRAYRKTKRVLSQALVRSEVRTLARRHFLLDAAGWPQWIASPELPREEEFGRLDDLPIAPPTSFEMLYTGRLQAALDLSASRCRSLSRHCH